MEAYSTYNLQVVLVAAFASLFSGYAISVTISTLGQPTFYASLKLQPVPTGPGYDYTVSVIGAILTVFFGSAVFGCFLSGYLSDKYGRVQGMRIAAIYGSIGAAVQTGAVNVPMYLVARVITGLATGHLLTAMGTYYSEIAPPHSRGLIGGAHGTFINAGFALSSWIGYACYTTEIGTFSWRFPNAVLCIWGLILLTGTLFVPESPRWLVSQDDDTKALAILCKLHHDKSDPEDHFAHRELGLIRRQLDVDRAAILADGRWQIFTKETYRRRLILAVMLLSGSQNIGVLVINSYNTILYQSLGLSNLSALILTSGYNTWSTITNFSGALISDRIGRRKILVTGFGMYTVLFVVAAALIAKYTETLSKNIAAAAVVFLFLSGTFYGSCIDVQLYTYASEIFPSHLRSQGTSIAFAAFFLCDTLWIGLQPTAFSKIGWKYYLVFICMGVAHTIHLYFKLPEVKGLALEEIDALFGKENVGHIGDPSLEKRDAEFSHMEDLNAEAETFHR